MSTSRGGSSLLRTDVHECAYAPARQAQLAFLSPEVPLDGPRYQLLLEQGFRRSGPYVYRPACPSCAACQSLRIPVDRFRPQRRHRRCLQANEDLSVQVRQPILTEQHMALYQRYIAERHPGSTMAGLGLEETQGFLTAAWCPTVFLEFWAQADGALLAVAVTDLLPRALSAVYTFFEPQEHRRGLGNLAVLWQVRHAARQGAAHVYLGYRIADVPGMAYKATFRPHEIYDGARWLYVE